MHDLKQVYGWARRISERIMKIDNSYLEFEDYVQIGVEAYLNQPEHLNAIKWGIYAQYKKYNKSDKYKHYKDELDDRLPANAVYLDNIITAKQLMNNLTTKQNALIDRVLNGETEKEMAKDYKLSRSAMHERKKRIYEQMADYNGES